MDYKGYNIAVHELGHNVEQVFSLYDVDHTLLAGVPNTAFTEALAFVFQAATWSCSAAPSPTRRPSACGCSTTSGHTWEIAGVALVDIAVWHWLYEHPEATPAAAARGDGGIAREMWNRYYAPVLGGRDVPLLGIYSHIDQLPLYSAGLPARAPDRVPDRGALKKARGRWARSSSAWPARAPHPGRLDAPGGGRAVSAEPLLQATRRALEATPMRTGS